MATRHLEVLMFHSISVGPGPTRIAPVEFRQQMDILAELGYRTVTVAQCCAWLAGQASLPERSVLITFDDGFADFAEVAWPILTQHAFSSLVFLPTHWLGSEAGWEIPACDATGRSLNRLMNWSTIRDLSRSGVEFGGHSIHHWNLNSLTRDVAAREIRGSMERIRDEIQSDVVAFAPPFGRAKRSVRALIGQFAQCSFTTELARVSYRNDPLNLPRIEMHYFRDPGRWRSHLLGQNDAWLYSRRFLRSLRQTAFDWFSLGTAPSTSKEFTP